MAKLKILQGRLIVCLNLAERALAIDTRNPAIDLGSIVTVFHVDHIWSDCLHSRRSGRKTREVAFPWYLEGRGDVYRYITSATRLDSVNGRAVVVAYGDRPGIVMDVNPSQEKFGLIAVTCKNAKRLSREIAKAVDGN